MHISPIIQVYYDSVTNDTLTNRHEFGRDRAFNFYIQFFTFNLYNLIFHSIYANLDPPWCLPGRKKTFNFEGTKTFNPWNERLTGDSEGSKSQKPIQFPAAQVNQKKKNGRD